MIIRTFISLILFVAAVSLAGCGQPTDRAASSAGDQGRCPHDIRKDMCPFCTPSLIVSEGYCGEHGVPEALCYQCRPYLKAAFRAKGDWCEPHKVPESQCMICHPELKSNIQPGTHDTTAPPGA